MVKMRSTQPKKNTQVIVFIWNELQIVHLQTKVLSISDKEYISVNTKSKNTEKQQCVHLGVRDTPLIQIYFSWKNANFHVDTKT